MKALRSAASWLPTPVVDALLSARDRWRCARAGVPPSPLGTDGVGYEALVAFAESRGAFGREGDALEIGTLLGGGALKLSRHLERRYPGKRLIVVDPFGHDWRARPDEPIVNLYRPGLLRRYGALSQREVFDRVVGARPNVVVRAEDSRGLDLRGVRLCFAFIDGDHDPDHVRGDFELAWAALSPGGCLALHDYGWHLPAATAAIDEAARRRDGEILERAVDADRHVLYLVKAATSSQR